MGAIRHTPAQIVLLLRQADDMLARGRRIVAVTAELGISEATFHRWRAQYGGIKADAAKRLSELEAENRQLRATLANQTLDIVVLRQLLSVLGADRQADLVETLCEGLNMSQRRACELVGRPRSTVRRALTAVGSHQNEGLPAAVGAAEPSLGQGALG